MASVPAAIASLISSEADSSSEIVSMRCSRPTSRLSRESRVIGPVATPLTRRTAGTILEISRAMWGGSTAASVDCESMAASTAPHLSWPSTTISGTLRTATAYSSDPTTLSEMTWPAFRTTKTSPRPRSKMISAESRESLHPNRAARGSWPSATSARRSASWWAWRGSPAIKRSLPSTIDSQALAGETELFGIIHSLGIVADGLGGSLGRGGAAVGETIPATKAAASVATSFTPAVPWSK